MVLTAELRGRLSIRPFESTDLPVDFLVARRLAGDLYGSAARRGGVQTAPTATQRGKACLPSIEGDALLRRSLELARRMAVSLLRVIRELHRATGKTEDVTAHLGRLDRLPVGRPCRRGPLVSPGQGTEALKVLRERRWAR